MKAEFSNVRSKPGFNLATITTDVLELPVRKKLEVPVAETSADTWRRKNTKPVSQSVYVCLYTVFVNSSKCFDT